MRLTMDPAAPHGRSGRASLHGRRAVSRRRASARTPRISSRGRSVSGLSLGPVKDEAPDGHPRRSPRRERRRVSRATGRRPIGSGRRSRRPAGRSSTTGPGSSCGRPAPPTSSRPTGSATAAARRSRRGWTSRRPRAGHGHPPVAGRPGRSGSARSTASAGTSRPGPRSSSSRTRRTRRWRRARGRRTVRPAGRSAGAAGGRLDGDRLGPAAAANAGHPASAGCRRRPARPGRRARPATSSARWSARSTTRRSPSPGPWGRVLDRPPPLGGRAAGRRRRDRLARRWPSGATTASPAARSTSGSGRPAHLATWWSLVLRDEGEDGPPRRAVRLADLPIVRRERAGGSGTAGDRRAGAGSRSATSTGSLDRFGRRRDLLGREPARSRARRRR